MSFNKKPFIVTADRKRIDNIYVRMGDILYAEGTFNGFPFASKVTVEFITRDAIGLCQRDIGRILLSPDQLANNLDDTRGRHTCLTFSFDRYKVLIPGEEEESKVDHYCIAHLLNDNEPFWDLETNSICFYSKQHDGYIVLGEHEFKHDRLVSSISFNDRFMPMDQVPKEYKVGQTIYLNDNGVCSTRYNVNGKRIVKTDTGGLDRVEYEIAPSLYPDEPKVIVGVDNDKYFQTPPTADVSKFLCSHGLKTYEAKVEHDPFSDIDILTSKFVTDKFTPGACYRINTPTLIIDALLSNPNCIQPDGLTFVRVVSGEDKPVTFTISPDQLRKEHIRIEKL